MTGTLRATRVPYESDSAEYDEAMGVLDEHAGCYPIKGELQVSWQGQWDTPFWRTFEGLTERVFGTKTVDWSQRVVVQNGKLGEKHFEVCNAGEGRLLLTVNLCVFLASFIVALREP